MLTTTHSTFAAPTVLRPQRPADRPPALSLPRALDELQHIAALSPALAVREGSLVLAHLLKNPAFLSEQLEMNPFALDPAATGPYVAWQVAGPQNAYALQVFVWQPGAVTAIHDHSTWGMIHGAFGTLKEERYTRLDAGEHTAQARLKRAWGRDWGQADGVSTLLPYDGGIHRISNPSSRPALSVHIYGPPGTIDGRDFDPRRDYVCDRLVENAPIALTLRAEELVG